MKILITGGAGYIGSMIAASALQNNYKVRVIDNLWFDEKVPLAHRDNPNYEFVRGDFSGERLLDTCLKDIGIVVHAAAVVGEPASKKFPELTKKINFDASLKLINKISSFQGKGLIFLSTCSNYGIAEGLATENTPLKPLSLYAETKVGVERYLMDKAKGIDWAICRLSTVYGVSSRMRFDLTVNDFTMNAFVKKYLGVFLPYTTRPYMHVFDIANVILEIIDKFDEVKNNVFNLGSNSQNYQKIKIAEIVKRFVPEIKIEILKSGTDSRDYQVDFSKLQRFFKFKEDFTVEDGVKEVLGLLKSRGIADPYAALYYNTSPNLGKNNDG